MEVPELLGTPEIVLLLGLALLVLGPSKLPEVAKSLGAALKEFKKASSEFETKTLGLDGRITESLVGRSQIPTLEDVEANQAPNIIKEEKKLQAKTKTKKRVTEVAEILGVEADGKTPEELWDEVVQRLKIDKVKSMEETKKWLD